ncbi:MAG: hypothetical protein FJ381_06380 [Verrucomicrobia bacterium]|nr:hypothetical protein [Verrucomicrobiota bacterium]
MPCPCPLRDALSSSALLSLALLLPRPLAAQAVAPAPAPAATVSAPPEAAVRLSPFEVSTDRDTGFAAASSMAGGRLATDLRDTPVAYSVVTRDFIDALNLVDLQSAAEWTTSSTVAVDNGQQNFFFNPVQYTVRGSGGGRPQRNFFPQFNNGDSYNLERYDFGRGPNAVLFGNGSLGGISSATTKRAQTNRATRQLQFAVGSWSNFRSTFDVNQPVGERFAVRAAGVWGDAGGWRLKDFDKRQAAFLTTTFRPFRDGELRVEGEYGRNSRQVAVTFLNDRFSGWNGTTYAAPRALTTLPANANAIGVGRRGPTTSCTCPSPRRTASSITRTTPSLCRAATARPPRSRATPSARTPPSTRRVQTCCTRSTCPRAGSTPRSACPPSGPPARSSPSPRTCPSSPSDSRTCSSPTRTAGAICTSRSPATSTAPPR